MTSATTWLDVSVPLGPEIPLWPGSPGVRISALKSRATGDQVNASDLAMDVHAGTHVDAPRHFIDEGATIDTVDPARMIGPAFVVDTGEESDISARLLSSLPIPETATRLLLRTVNSRDAALYSSPFDEGYAALSPDGAEWIAQNRIDVVGVDYLSVQKFSDPPDAHLTLLGADVVVIEGLDLRGIQEGWHEMICLPLLLASAEAAPARVVVRPLRHAAPAS